MVIDNNVILLNESFTEGGGILLSGEAVPAGAPATALNVGTGNVTISRNLIQGNHAGSSGGGILTRFVNGQDVAANPADPTMWYRVDILNNLIVNNVGSHLAGGIAVADAANINILHNTIAHNDSTGTGTEAFGGPCNPQFQFNCGPEGPIESERRRREFRLGRAGGGHRVAAALREPGQRPAGHLRTNRTNVLEPGAVQQRHLAQPGVLLGPDAQQLQREPHPLARTTRSTGT